MYRDGNAADNGVCSPFSRVGFAKGFPGPTPELLMYDDGEGGGSKSAACEVFSSFASTGVPSPEVDLEFPACPPPPPGPALPPVLPRFSPGIWTLSFGLVTEFWREETRDDPSDPGMYPLPAPATPWPIDPAVAGMDEGGMSLVPLRMSNR